MIVTPPRPSPPRPLEPAGRCWGGPTKMQMPRPDQDAEWQKQRSKPVHRSFMSSRQLSIDVSYFTELDLERFTGILEKRRYVSRVLLVLYRMIWRTLAMA